MVILRLLPCMQKVTLKWGHMLSGMKGCVYMYKLPSILDRTTIDFLGSFSHTSHGISLTIHSCTSSLAVACNTTDYMYNHIDIRVSLISMVQPMNAE